MKTDKYQLYTTKEIAKILKVSLITVKRYLKENKILSVKIGGARRVRKEDFENFIKSQQLTEIYKNLEKDIKISYIDNFKKLVNFSTNLEKPIHRWFNIKEGYSEDLVNNLIKRYKINSGYILDPFSGSGTTLISGLKNNINTIGFEINPFLAFLSKIKISSKVSKRIKKHLEKIKKLNKRRKFSKPKLSIIDKLFKENLRIILATKNYIDKINNKDDQNILKLAFLCSLEESSYAKKDGNGLKYPKNKKPKKFLYVFDKKIEEIITDTKKRNYNTENSLLFNIDSRLIYDFLKNRTKLDSKDYLKQKSINHLKKLIGKINLTVFSPPYMNCFDYTEIYKVELWMGDFVKEYDDLKFIRNDSISSHLNKTYYENINFDNQYVSFFKNLLSEKKLWDKKIPFMVNDYFRDIAEVLKSIYVLLKKKGRCVIVVGNSAYGSIAIPTDLILGKIGLEAGFKKVEIEVTRKLGTSSQQYKTINKRELLRESLVILEK